MIKYKIVGEIIKNEYSEQARKHYMKNIYFVGFFVKNLGAFGDCFSEGFFAGLPTIPFKSLQERYSYKFSFDFQSSHT